MTVLPPQWIDQLGDETKVFRDLVASEVEDVVTLFVDAKRSFWVSETQCIAASEESEFVLDWIKILIFW